jgi:NTP pyrophosphatase (non-canonical NTP hydrolase)
MNPREEELFGILQEEAAEVIQVVSKRRRFGVSERNVKELEQELGDFIAVLKLLVEEGYIDLDKLEPAVLKKIAKLKLNMSNNS